MCMDIYYIPIHPEFLTNFPLDRFCIGLVSPFWIPGSSWQVAATNGFKPLPQRKCHGNPMTCQESLRFRMNQVSFGNPLLG